MKVKIMFIFALMFFSLFNTLIVKENIVVKADNPPLQPYDYWFAPENSFGISSLKTPNATYFDNTFRNNITANLYYRVNGGDWVLGNQYLTFGKVFNESLLGYKITSGFLNPTNKRPDVTFIITINKDLLNYVNKSGNYVYILNYTVENEIYSCIFNFSDLANKADIVRCGIKNNKAYIAFTKFDIPEYSYYEFDPWFGYDNIGSGSSNIENRWDGLRITSPVTGYVQNITVALKYSISGNPWKVNCSFHYGANGTKIADTVERSLTLTTSFVWYTFNFSVPVYIIEGVDYSFGVMSEDRSGYSYVAYSDQESPNGCALSISSGLEYPYMPNPTDTTIYNVVNYSIYASYTLESGESWCETLNNCPSYADPTINNKTTGVSISTVNFGVRNTDLDGNSTSGWINCSSGNNTYFSGDINQIHYIYFNGTLQYSTNYTIWINESDDDCQCQKNYWLWFVTENAPFSNTCPIATNPNPNNKTINVNLSVNWSIYVSDIDGNVTNGWINCSSGNTSNWSSLPNGTRYLNITGLSYSTNYTVWVEFEDEFCHKNYSYWFITKHIGWFNTCPIATNPNPNNKTINVNLSVNWSIYVSDIDGNVTNGWINCSSGNTSNWSSLPNGTRYLNITGLSYSTNYTVWVEFEDEFCYKNYSYWFITKSLPVNITYINAINPNPANNSIQTIIITNLTIYITSTSGLFNYSIEFKGYNKNETGVTNGTKFLSISGFNFTDETIYIWYINITSGNGSNANYYFKFTYSNLSLYEMVYRLYELYSGESMNINIDYSLVGIILTLVLFFFATKRYDFIFMLSTTLLSLVTGVTMIMNNSMISVFWFIGIIFTLFAVYTSMLTIIYGIFFGVLPELYLTKLKKE